MLNFIKKFIPKKIFTALQPSYHFLLGYLAALWYGNPSEKMIVVGVTGTTGKTTTIYLIAEMLKSAGIKAGYISTALFGDGEKEWLNDRKMTMLGRFFTQKILKRMQKNGCKVAIVETTSQGILQFRHRFINYDTLLFTGLYPEHIEAHGGFENYKKAKGKLFEHLKECKKKKISGKEIPKISIINTDDEHGKYFLDFWAEKKITFGEKTGECKAEEIFSDASGIRLGVGETVLNMQIIGRFNVMNALAAVCVGRTLDVPAEKIKEGLEKIEGIPGRLEKIKSDKKFTVIVDYAFEPNALTKLYETVALFQPGKIIHVLGSTGGGRDKSRRPKLGNLAGEKADYVIVTNEDPYDEDPGQIVNEVASGIANKKEGKDFWKIIDRREAIEKALSLAEENDLVLITGKGSEQAICVADGKMIPWDDREVVKEELVKLA